MRSIRYSDKVAGIISKTRGLKAGKLNNSGAGNRSFGGLTYDTSVHFAHFPESFLAQTGIRSTMQLAKYPRVLYAKPSSKMFTF